MLLKQYLKYAVKVNIVVIRGHGVGQMTTYSRLLIRRYEIEPH